MEQKDEENQDELHKTEVITDVQIRDHTESDAVHPRFHKTSKEEIEDYQRIYHYYCTPCRAYFAPTVLGLREHFRVGRINHVPTASCIYCEGPVYNYNISERVMLYHECNDR